MPSCLLYALFAIWGERKLSAFIQDRLGPNEVGPKGLLQTFADILKLMQKEDIVATANYSFIFKSAPYILFVVSFMAFALVPLGPQAVASNTNTGIYLLLAILSIDIIGFLFGAWGSNNKFSILAGMRTVAQMFSFEIPLSLVVLGVVMLTETMNLDAMTQVQGVFSKAVWFGIDLRNFVGFFTWNIIAYPFVILGFVIFIITALGEANRAPFDHAEAESELIAGVFTEYSGFRFSIMALSEYIIMLLMGVLGAILFFGGYLSPLPNIGLIKLNDWTSGTLGEFSCYAWGYFWLMLKAIVWVCVCMWVRWTYPRVRIDQVMHLSWKVLTPASLFFVFVCGVCKLIQVS